MLRTHLAVGAAVSAIVLAGPAGAHHAFNMYDNTKYLKLTGTVKSYHWANPHTMIGRHGWTADSLKPGDKVDFVIHPNRTGVQYGLLVSATKTDGAVLKDKD
jgi:hypothetical protein